MQKAFERIALGKKSLSAFSYELEIQNSGNSTILASVTLLFGRRILTKINVSVPVKPGNSQDMEKSAMSAICQYIAGSATNSCESSSKNYSKKEYKSKGAAQTDTQAALHNLFSSLNL